MHKKKKRHLIKQLHNNTAAPLFSKPYKSLACTQSYLAEHCKWSGMSGHCAADLRNLLTPIPNEHATMTFQSQV